MNHYTRHYKSFHSFHFFLSYFGYFRSFAFPYELKNQLANFYIHQKKISPGIFTRIALNLKTNLGKTGILTLSLLIHEYSICMHLFRSSLISISSILEFSCRSLTSLSDLSLSISYFISIFNFNLIIPCQHIEI